MKVRTERIGYKPGPDEVVLDITVKNNPGHVLAPTWDLVMDFKKGKISWDMYKNRYLQLLRERWKTRKNEFIRIFKESQGKTIVLLCFCSDETKCHRSIAKEVLEKINSFLSVSDRLPA